MADNIPAPATTTAQTTLVDNTKSNVASTPPALASMPSTPAELPVTDFSQFEQARDLQFKSPAPEVLKTPTETPTSTQQPPSVPTTTPPTTTLVPGTQQTPPLAPTTTPTTGVDKDGKPLPVEIDFSQSALAREMGGPQIQAAQTTQLNPSDIIEGRDMTGFSTEEREAFKRMSNESFNLLAPAYRESKSIKTTLETTRKENETLKQQVQQRGASIDPIAGSNLNGFIFDPQYQQTLRVEQNIGVETQYWNQQLAALKSGQKPRMLIYDNQSGRYSQGQELNPDAETESFLIGKLTEANALKTQVAQYKGGIEQGWRQQVAVDAARIKQAEDAYFPWFAEGKTHSFGPVIDGFIKQLPPTQQANPLARVLGKAWAVIQHLQGQVTKAKTTGIVNSNVVPQTTSNQGPLQTTGVATATQVNGQGINGTGAQTGDELMAMYDTLKRG